MILHTNLHEYGRGGCHYTLTRQRCYSHQSLGLARAILPLGSNEDVSEPIISWSRKAYKVFGRFAGRARKYVHSKPRATMISQLQTLLNRGFLSVQTAHRHSRRTGSPHYTSASLCGTRRTLAMRAAASLCLAYMTLECNDDS